jgi:hypothetical protein
VVTATILSRQSEITINPVLTRDIRYGLATAQTSGCDEKSEAAAANLVLQKAVLTWCVAITPLPADDFHKPSFVEGVSGPRAALAPQSEKTYGFSALYICSYALVRRDDGRGTWGELFTIALHRLLHAVVWYSAIGREGRPLIGASCP